MLPTVESGVAPVTKPLPMVEADFCGPDFSELSKLVYQPNYKSIRAVLNQERLTVADLAVLLSPAAGASLREMATRAAEITNRRFGRAIQI